MGMMPWALPCAPPSSTEVFTWVFVQGGRMRSRSEALDRARQVEELTTAALEALGKGTLDGSTRLMWLMVHEWTRGLVTGLEAR
jgi:hypothetical protein